MTYPLKIVLAGLLALGFSNLTALADSAPPPVFDPVLDADPFTAEELLTRPLPNASAALDHYLRGVVAASKLDATAAERELSVAYDDPKAPADIARRALSVAGSSALRAGDYRRAAELFDRELSRYGTQMSERERTGDEQNRAAAMALRDQPAQTIEAQVTGTIPLGKHDLGLTTMPTEINGQAQVAVVDTGTSIAALSATAAKRLGVRMLSGKVSAGSSTVRSLAVTAAIADTVKVGPATLHHVVFIVIDDAALAPMGPEHRIDAIIGFPVLAALGRITFHAEGSGAQEHRSLLIAPSAGRAAGPGTLRFQGYDFYARITADGQTLPFYVDSGSNKTGFDKRYAREFPARLSGLQRRVKKVGGAGGIEKRQVAIIPNLAVILGGSTIELSNVAVDLTGNGSETNYGSVGADILWAKGGYTIDFGALDLSLGG
jgi:predicted aspartyl protease